MSVTRNQPDPSSESEGRHHIVRAATRPRYTVVVNQAIEDANLSFRALGLLTYLLSKPDFWTIRLDQLANSHSEGKDAVRTALAELREHRYIIRTQKNDPVTGHLVWESVVYETPATPEEIPVQPTSGTPKSGNPTSGSATLVSTEVVSTDVAKTEKRKHTSEFDAWFNQFWSFYPRHDGTGAAEDALERALKKTDLQTICTAAAALAALGLEKKYTPMASTWLNQERWRDDPVSSKAETKQDRSRGNLMKMVNGEVLSLSERLRAAGATDAVETSRSPTLVGLTANGRHS